MIARRGDSSEDIVKNFQRIVREHTYVLSTKLVKKKKKKSLTPTKFQKHNINGDVPCVNLDLEMSELIMEPYLMMLILTTKFSIHVKFPKTMSNV